MAKNCIDNLSEETRKGMQEKAEEGEFPAYAPLGYLHDKTRKTIELDPQRAPIIRQMSQQYTTGKFSIRRLEVQAAREGLTTRKGHRVARSSVAQILKNLDGEVEEAFYRRNVSQWRAEQADIRARIERHEKADQNYIEQGIRLLEIARNAQEFYRKQGQAERAALLSFIMPGSTLKDDQVIPTFKPPFDIIHRIAQEARATQGIKKQAPAPANACPTLLPLLDELKTYCYEHKMAD